MSLLNNAIQAIECGIEDYKVGSDARLKSSIRNVHAGILLLLKEKLSRLSEKGSDEALLKARVIPHINKDKIIWKGKGPRTVDNQALQERLEALRVTFDWKMFRSVTDLRNDVEHYYTSANSLAITEALAKSFLLMRNFMLKELKIDPMKKLNGELWEYLIRIDLIYKKELQICKYSHKFFKSESKLLNSKISEIECIDCGSDLIKFKSSGSSACRSCQSSFDREKTILNAIDSAFGWSTYIAAKEGADSSIEECPECTLETYIADDMICASCGASQTHECQICGCIIPNSEFGSSLCAYCDHIMSIEKD